MARPLPSPEDFVVYTLGNDGIPIEEPDHAAWGRWMMVHLAERKVAEDVVGDVKVSTIFVGMEGGLYETTVFGGPDHGYQRRYATRQEAVAGHEAVVLQIP